MSLCLFTFGLPSPSCLTLCVCMRVSHSLSLSVCPLMSFMCLLFSSCIKFVCLESGFLSLICFLSYFNSLCLTYLLLLPLSYYSWFLPALFPAVCSWFFFCIYVLLFVGSLSVYHLLFHISIWVFALISMKPDTVSNEYLWCIYGSNHGNTWQNIITSKLIALDTLNT